jgi:hypothetical protein
MLLFPRQTIPASPYPAEQGYVLAADPSYSERRALLAAAWAAVVEGEDDDVFLALLAATSFAHRCRLAAELAFTEAHVDPDLMQAVKQQVPSVIERAAVRAFGYGTRPADVWLALATCVEIVEPEQAWLVLSRNGRASYARAIDSRYYLSPSREQVFILRLAEDRDLRKRERDPIEDNVIECALLNAAGVKMANLFFPKA